MRNFPEADTFTTEAEVTAKLEELRAEPWQVDLLKMNPDYTSWGPYEDYMFVKGNEGGWNSRLLYETWADFNVTLDDMNEVVNFYFEVVRPSKPCEACDETGYNPLTKFLADTFYDHNSPGSRNRWCDKLTQEEVDYLYEKGRLTRFPVKPTAEVVNGNRFLHDAINRYLLIEFRAQKHGFFGHCEACDGKGYIYTQDHADAGLVLWLLHPRKGASRGVHIKKLEQSDKAKAFTFLRQARDRNAARFSKIPPE
jgi:hypothetical protein